MGPKLREGEAQNRHLAGEGGLKADHVTIQRNRAASWRDGAHFRSAAPVRREPDGPTCPSCVVELEK